MLVKQGSVYFQVSHVSVFHLKLEEAILFASKSQIPPCPLYPSCLVGV